MPAAALGASAKFRQDGRAERGRYHVALALPCGATDRALVADSALRAAKANNTAAVIKNDLSSVFFPLDWATVGLETCFPKYVLSRLKWRTKLRK